jgi:hypothetical protein
MSHCQNCEDLGQSCEGLDRDLQAARAENTRLAAALGRAANLLAIADEAMQEDPDGWPDAVDGYEKWRADYAALASPAEKGEGAKRCEGTCRRKDCTATCVSERGHTIGWHRCWDHVVDQRGHGHSPESPGATGGGEMPIVHGMPDFDRNGGVLLDDQPRVGYQLRAYLRPNGWLHIRRWNDGEEYSDNAPKGLGPKVVAKLHGALLAHFTPKPGDPCHDCEGSGRGNGGTTDCGRCDGAGHVPPSRPAPAAPPPVQPVCGRDYVDVFVWKACAKGPGHTGLCGPAQPKGTL